MAAISMPAFTARAAADDELRVSGPYVHDNLAVYFLHGPSAPGPVPLTLSEALARGTVKLFETGEVNELKIENTGSEPVFIQAGDIVKGGKQDRAITASLVLPPKSGEVSLAAFCVEQGRWSRRGSEEVLRFASSAESMPSREAKMAMRKPAPTATASVERNDSSRSYTATRQAEVWDSVGKMQKKFSAGANENVAAALSASSLQLSLENEKLNERRSVYVKALEGNGNAGDDIVGYAFAINGKINSADVYASNGLFRKMWTKQLQSAAAEALGETSEQTGIAPNADAVKLFLASAKQGAVQKSDAAIGEKLEIRESSDAMYFAASPVSAARAFVHENYLAKK